MFVANKILHAMEEQQKKNVLIIEQDAIIALDIQRRFLDQGYNVLGTTATLSEALKRAPEFKNVDLILVDAGLADFYLRFPLAEKMYRSHETPLILLASSMNEKINSLCNEHESVKVLQKPFDNKEFLQAVDSVMNNVN